MIDPRENMTDDEIKALEHVWFGKAIQGLDEALDDGRYFKTPIYNALLILKNVYAHSDWENFEDNLTEATTTLGEVVDNIMDCLHDEFWNIALDGLNDSIFDEYIPEAEIPCNPYKENQNVPLHLWLNGLTQSDVVGQPSFVLYAEYCARAQAKWKKPMGWNKFYYLLRDKFDLREVVRQVGDGVVYVYAPKMSQKEA